MRKRNTGTAFARFHLCISEHPAVHFLNDWLDSYKPTQKDAAVGIKFYASL
jgi:hypothetical protein